MIKIGEILQCGIFDSRKQFQNVKKTPQRRVAVFEFDFFISCDKNAVCRINANSYKIFPQSMIVRKPGQLSNSALHFKCYCLHLQIENDSPFYSELNSLPEFYPIINGNVYSRIFEEIFRLSVNADDGADDYLLSAKLLELFHYLLTDAARNKNCSAMRTPNENGSIQNAIKYMKEHYEHKITLKTLGDLTGYTPNYFRNVFTQIAGMSPQKFLERIRLDRAKYLLAQNETTIAQIAYVCGFSSQAHFSMIFKRATQLTPKEFRAAAVFRYEE
jgi:transcriptional regulator, araC family